MNMRRIAVIACVLAASRALFAAAGIQSTQGHTGAVTSFAPTRGTDYFSAGNDGFVIRWNEQGVGERFQISDLKIKLIACHPNGDEIAVYETNGFTVHRISVWNWRTKTRRYAKRFTDTVTSLAYTQRGTYIAAGTTSVNGIVFLQSSTGNQVRKILEQTGTAALFASNDAESSCVIYSPSGHISYYSLANGRERARFLCEPNLSQSMLFGNNLFLAGVKNGEIFVILATSGEILGRVSARSPLLIPSPNELFYVEQSGRNGSIKMLDPKGTLKSPLVVKNWSIPESSAFTAAAFGRNLIFGTLSGSVYSTSTFPEVSSVQLTRVSQNAFQKILDIAVFPTGEFCFLTASEIFVSQNGNPIKTTLSKNTESHTNMLCTDSGLIVLWSKDTRKAVILLEPARNSPQQGIAISYNAKKIFTPRTAISLVQVFDSNIVFIEGNSSVSLCSLKPTGTPKQIYTGTGIQDAFLNDKGELYIAKSAASNPPSPLILVDTLTRETVRLSLRGDAAYALATPDAGNEQALTNTEQIYGITLTAANSPYADSKSAAARTTLFAYNTSSRSAQNLITYADEDVTAFTYIYNSLLYTNIGKTHVIAFNLRTRTQTQLERGAALAVKVMRNNAFIAVLGSDGSVLWYRAQQENRYGSTQGAQAVLAHWYLKINGEWEPGFTSAALNETADALVEEDPVIEETTEELAENLEAQNAKESEPTEEAPAEPRE
jgi:WD40 repeat protein